MSIPINFFSLAVYFIGFSLDFSLRKLTYNKKKYLISIMQFCFVVPLLWFGSNSNVQLLYILVPLLGTFAFIYSPVMNTLIGELVPLRLAGTAAGFVNACWQLGSLFALCYRPRTRYIR